MGDHSFWTIPNLIYISPVANFGTHPLENTRESRKKQHHHHHSHRKQQKKQHRSQENTRPITEPGHTGTLPRSSVRRSTSCRRETEPPMRPMTTHNIMSMSMIGRLLKFIYSEKPTKFCKIFPVFLSIVHTDKLKGQILQNFVAFTEYMSFKIFSKTGFVLLWFCSNMCQYCKVCGVFEAEHDKSHVLHICRCVFLLSFFETVAIVQLQPCHFWIKSFDNAVVERIAFFEEFRRKCAFILSGPV